MFLIPLSNDRFALIDDDDVDLMEFKWYARKDRTQLYARRNLPREPGRRPQEDLHRAIGDRMGILSQVDHRNRHGLDCRRCNLRPATHRENKINQGLRKDNVSGLKGVKAAGKRKWMARITVDGKLRYLGSFDDKFEAARAYDAAAVSAFGEFAALNFPVQK